MISNFPRVFATFILRPEPPDARGDRFDERVLARIQQAVCGLRGHAELMQFEKDRMFLRCLSCGHESSGWRLDRPDVSAA
jgi:hypothetical protein